MEILEQENLCGFIFKTKSPISGLYRIKVYQADGSVRHTGSGLFARAFTKRFPRIPVEEDGRLNDPKLRENFIESIFTLKRWRDLLADNKTLGKQQPLNQLFDEYEALLLKALTIKTTLKKNINGSIICWVSLKKTWPPLKNRN